MKRSSNERLHGKAAKICNQAKGIKAGFRGEGETLVEDIGFRDGERLRGEVNNRVGRGLIGLGSVFGEGS